MKQYQFTFTNPQRASYKKSILAIIGLNLIFFIYLAFTTQKLFIRHASILVIFFVVASFTIKYFWKRIGKEYNAVLPDLVFFIFMYCYLGFWWPAVAILLIAIFYLVAIRKLIVIFTENGIDYPSFPRKKIQWPALQNVILKDGLLTIDFVNNKLLQTDIEPQPNEMRVNEKEFNDFCREQLKK